MNESKNRHTVWLTDETWSKVKDHYRTDNCSTQNEYIEKAIQFYSGYLDTEQADNYLPRVLSDVVEGKLSALGSRIGKLLFKLSVDDAVMAHLIAAIADVDLDTLKKMRSGVSRMSRKRTARSILRTPTNSRRGSTDAGADSKEQIYRTRLRCGELCGVHRHP